jgi:uncharacterized protein YkwD
MDGRRPNSGRRSGITASAFITALVDTMIMPVQFPMRLLLVAFWFSLSFTATTSASDYAGAINAYRRAHGLPAVRSDSGVGAVALKQARGDGIKRLAEPQRR